jgi:hypothetical protein
MGFKMKGPGLPGFRKQVGRGFYKSPGFNINTSNRSPMKQGEEDEYTEAQQKALDIKRKNLQKYLDGGGDPDKINWEKTVETEKRIVDDNKTIIELAKSQHGVIPGETPTSIVRPGDPGYDAWVKAVEGGAGKQFEDQEVYRGDVGTEVIEAKPEVEWTNFKLAFSNAVGPGQSSKIDNNDGSKRYTISGVEGTMMNGELSRNDIEQKVKEGVFKYEVDSNGKSTGNLLMSKDYHENTYTPMVEIYEKGQENYNNHFAGREEWLTNSRKEMNAQLTEEFGNKKNKAYKQKFKELNDARIKEGIDLNYYTGGRNNRKGTDIDESATAGAGNHTYGGNPGAMPDFMRGNPNYGLMFPSIVNDDEVEPNTGFKKGVKNNQKINGDLVQGHRLQDWEWNEELGKAVLKEDAITMTDEKWNSLSQEEKNVEHNRDHINGTGMKIKPKEGYRKDDGTSVIGQGVTRKETHLDHLLTNPREYIETENGLESTNFTDQTSALGGTDWFKHNLSLGGEEHQSMETMDDPTLATEVTETDAEYSAEDLAKIETYNNIKNQ